MSDFKKVSEALASGIAPKMLCMTCPWDRLCIVPPSLSAEDVKKEIEKSNLEDKELADAARLEGKAIPLPMGMLMTSLLFSGKDLQAEVCPVFTTRVRGSNGRSIADLLRNSMKAWDDEEVKI